MSKAAFSKLIFLIVIALATFIIIFFLNNKDRFDPSQQIVDINIKNKQLIKPKDPISINQNKKITFYINIDEPEELHLEGYHAFLKLSPDKTNKFEFESLSPGKFHLYLDKSHTYLGTVEITPN